MKRPTQFDVARKAGVSRATVSLVMNGRVSERVPISTETRERVLRAIAELGYRPDARAQALRSGDTNLIGLIVPDTRNPHFWSNIAGVEEEAQQAGYNLMYTSLGLVSEYGDILFENLLHQRVDGVILMGSYINDSDKGRRSLQHLQHHQMAVVELNERLNPDLQLDSVIANYRSATRDVMEHLVSLGHSRIGFIYGVASPLMGLDRLEPYQQFLHTTGLPQEPELVIHCGPELDEGYRAAHTLLQLPKRPTAIVTINDLLALGAMRAAADLGLRIPADLSLVGYDDIFVDPYTIPRLTTVSKDAVGMGRTAARLLIERIEHPNRPRQVIEFASRLILRDSTGPVPAHL